MVKQGNPNINGRITVLNGKFKTERGDRDATMRYGKNIPLDTPIKFSAGYTGEAMRKLSDAYLEKSANGVK